MSIKRFINDLFRNYNDKTSKYSLVDSKSEELELDKRSITPREVFNPNKSLTLRESEWNVVYASMNLAYMTTRCQDDELGKVMSKLVNQL